MPSDKTRPIGDGMKNITATITNGELADLEHLVSLSGCDRSPYLRTLTQWAIDNRVIVRPVKAEYTAYLDAIRRGEKAPKYNYEVVATRLKKPLIVIMDAQESMVDFDEEQHSLRVAEVSPTHAAVSHSPVPRRKKK